MWPMSPAAPWAPRCRRPPLITPDPMPVATFTKSRCSTSAYSVVCSPSAMMFTSLSTRTGPGSSRPSRPATSYESQPGMIGGWFGRPVLCSTGPGRPTPVPTRSSGERRAARSRDRPVRAMASRTTSGPWAMFSGCVLRSRISPVRSVRATERCVAPTSAARMSRAAGFNRNRAGGRPPVEAASPDGTTRPAASSASTRVVTVDRARPLRSMSSARVRGCPSSRRRRTASSPVVPNALIIGLPSTGRGLLLDRVQKGPIASYDVSTSARKPSTRLRVGIVGGGFMGQVHGRSALVSGATVAGAVGSSPERAEAAAEATGAERGFATLDELLATDIDVVHVCTPNNTHLDVTLKAFEAGKHVICEKPLATSVQDAAGLQAAALEGGLVGAVPFVYRYHPMVRELRTRIAAGDAGVITSLHGSYLQDWLAGADDQNWRVDDTTGGPSRAFADNGPPLGGPARVVPRRPVAPDNAPPPDAQGPRGGG